MSADNKPLVGSPDALGRLFSGGILSWRQFPMRLSRAQRVARRKEIFGSFTRAIAHAKHRIPVLAEAQGDQIFDRSFDSVKKREARRLAALRVRAMAIPGSNRKPRKGPSAGKREAIKRREAKRLRHEERTRLGLGAAL